MSFTSIIQFHVTPGREAAFEEASTNAGMLTRPSAINGFVKVELVSSLTDPVAYYVVGEWLTEQSYANWQAVSMVEADQDALVAMRATLVDHAPGRLFSTVSRSK